MTQSYRKGVAIHPDPESCVASREAAIEALTRAPGRVFSCEIFAFRVPTSFNKAEGNIEGPGACHDGWDGAASVSENAITDAGPEDDTQGQQTHQGLQWKAQQKQNSQKQNDHSKAWDEAGNALIVAAARDAAAGRASELDIPVASSVGRIGTPTSKPVNAERTVRRFRQRKCPPEGRDGRALSELFEAFLLLTAHARTRRRDIW